MDPTLFTLFWNKAYVNIRRAERMKMHREADTNFFQSVLSGVGANFIFFL